jgi:hypothetical protein
MFLRLSLTCTFQVLANYNGDTEWTAQEEKKLTRKIDRRLLSILCITYGLQYYDKSMLSQAVGALDFTSETGLGKVLTREQALFGLRTDLDLDVGIRFSLSSAIFYLGFICGAYPAILLAQRFPIFGIVFLWGQYDQCNPILNRTLTMFQRHVSFARQR